jgi:hypothetical protein
VTFIAKYSSSTPFSLKTKIPEKTLSAIFLVEYEIYSDTQTANNVPMAESQGANELINFHSSTDMHI